MEKIITENPLMTEYKDLIKKYKKTKDKKILFEMSKIEYALSFFGYKLNKSEFLNKKRS